MTEIEKDILKKFKNQLQERMPVLSIILFGSRARGDAEPGSDMDVLVLVEGIDVVTARAFFFPQSSTRVSDGSRVL
jgi:predicted nucleotidyltransferase